MSEIQKIGRYEIIQEKGRGAMGSVFIARDPAMDRVVAVKTIHSLALQGPQAAEYRERFYREARASGRLAHPGIVPMFDVGEQDDLPYLVMEYIEGQTLADAAKGGQRFTLERVCEIGQQIAEALGYAHKNGVVHRDIKPANILLTSKEKYGIERPKITDFGIAKLSAAQITTTGQMLGTPAFMPPEQFTGATIDGRSDLFSLGVILYWLATGEQAFPGETVTAVSYKVVHTEPVPPRKLNPSIPSGLEHVIMKSLAKDPAVRYQSGEDLAHELSAVRAGRTAAELASSINITAAPGSDSGMDVTLDSNPGFPVEPPTRQSALKVPPPPEQVVATAPTKKSAGSTNVILGVSVAIAVLAGGLYAYKRTHVSAQSQAAPSEMVSNVPTTTPVAAVPPSAPAYQSSTATPSVDTTPEVSKPETSQVVPPAASKKTSKTSKPVSDTTKSAAVTPAPAVVTPPPAAPVVETPKPVAPARVDFDPRTLSPNENTRLRIEADRFPPSVNFTLELNGKILFERGSAKTQTSFDDILIPPGVHELRVVAGTGSNRKSSNIVSTEFKAKKKKTLRVELRTQGRSSDAGIPQDIYADSQIFVTLK
jgi:serine/threonine protein kinase